MKVPRAAVIVLMFGLLGSMVPRLAAALTPVQRPGPSTQPATSGTPAPQANAIKLTKLPDRVGPAPTKVPDEFVSPTGRRFRDAFGPGNEAQADGFVDALAEAGFDPSTVRILPAAPKDGVSVAVDGTDGRTLINANTDGRGNLRIRKVLFPNIPGVGGIVFSQPSTLLTPSTSETPLRNANGEPIVFPYRDPDMPRGIGPTILVPFDQNAPLDPSAPLAPFSLPPGWTPVPGAPNLYMPPLSPDDAKLLQGVGIDPNAWRSGGMTIVNTPAGNQPLVPPTPSPAPARSSTTTGPAPVTGPSAAEQLVKMPDLAPPSTQKVPEEFITPGAKQIRDALPNHPERADAFHNAIVEAGFDISSGTIRKGAGETVIFETKTAAGTVRISGVPTINGITIRKELTLAGPGSPTIRFNQPAPPRTTTGYVPTFEDDRKLAESAGLDIFTGKPLPSKGGAIEVKPGTPTIQNSTVGGNTAGETPVAPSPPIGSPFGVGPTMDTLPGLPLQLDPTNIWEKSWGRQPRLLPVPNLHLLQNSRGAADVVHSLAPATYDEAVRYEVITVRVVVRSAMKRGLNLLRDWLLKRPRAIALASRRERTPFDQTRSGPSPSSSAANAGRAAAHEHRDVDRRSVPRPGAQRW